MESTAHIFDWLFAKKIRFFLILLVLHIFLRSSSLYTPFLDIDEAQFSGFAHALMDGGKPYASSVDTKPPFIYLFYALGFALFGKYNMVGIHGLGILWSFLTAYSLYALGKKISRPQAGIWAALFYVIFSTTYFPKFIAVSITSIMVLPLSLSILCWIQSKENQSHRFDFLSGFLTGIAFLFKYQAGIQLVIFFADIILDKRARAEIRNSSLRLGFCLIGFLMPIGFTFLVLHQMGVWSDFIQWSLVGSLHYIESGAQTISFFENLFLRGGAFILSTILLWILFIRYCLINKLASLRLFFLWFGLSWIPVLVGGRFYGHYFLQILPPLCIIAGLAASQITKPDSFKKILIMLVLPSLIFWMVRLDQKTIYSLFPDDGLDEQMEIGNFLKANTDPQETLFVWGVASAIYFHAERKPASRFLWTDLLTGKVPGSEISNDPSFETSAYVRPEAWVALWEDFKTPPTYFVDTSVCNIHNYKKYPIDLYPELRHFLKSRYRFWKNVEGCLVYKKK